MKRSKKSIATMAAVGVAGMVGGGILATTAFASAEGTTGGTAAAGEAAAGQQADPTKPMRSDEKLLTGTTKDKVTAAVKAKYPDATIQRVETDSDGVYEAHVLNGGTPLVVEVGKDFTITGTETGGPGGGQGGGPGGAPGTPPPTRG